MRAVPIATSVSLDLLRHLTLYRKCRLPGARQDRLLAALRIRPTLADMPGRNRTPCTIDEDTQMKVRPPWQRARPILTFRES
jgi:hypothetical protein